MEEILHQLIGSCSHYLQGFIHPRWLAGFLNHQQYQPTFSTFLIGYTLKILGYNLMGRHHLHLCKSRFFKYIFCIANTSEKMCLHQKKDIKPQKNENLFEEHVSNLLFKNTKSLWNKPQNKSWLVRKWSNLSFRVSSSSLLQKPISTGHELCEMQIISHGIHGIGIYTYIYHKINHSCR